jgi:carbamoyl-phosphate synthase small subunit
MKAILALEDGTLFHGESFTGQGVAGGEVIFNTGMTGYQEVLTDPSYHGQMVCMTYPHIGNYGVNPADVESSKIHVAGFIVKECCKSPSNWRATASLPDYLARQGVMGLEGIDTRALTRHLRLHGAMRGYISTDVSDPRKIVEAARSLPSMEGLGLADRVTCAGPYRFDGEKQVPVDLVDGTYAGPVPAPGWRPTTWASSGTSCAARRTGLRRPGRALHVHARPGQAPVPDAIFLSNGPGDPAALPGLIEATAVLADIYPTAGICLGHQLLGLALGGRTFKLKFGHHGLNHPVKDLEPAASRSPRKPRILRWTSTVCTTSG